MASATDFCSGCKTIAEIIYTETETDRSFCKKCTVALPPSSEELALIFLALTVPFKVGDRVEARTAGQIFDGVGTVEEISTELKNGGTRVFPSFRVKLETKEHDQAPDEAWYTECCLKHPEGVEA